MKKRLEKLLEKSEDVVLRIELIEEATRGLLYVIKAKIVFINDDSLYLREIRRGDELVAYSYYWFNSMGELIEGWDNAPHHKDVETYPNHNTLGMALKVLRTQT
nr:DUF6516 family protein [Candidatus Freyarchaeota archaeon]